MGNWALESCRMFYYFGDQGRFFKRLFASRALSGWKDIYEQPKNPRFVENLIFTKDVTDAMILHAYGEHLRDMGKST